MITELEQLYVEAPESLMTRVLVDTGLADGYVSRPSGIGDVWIAFNGNGVSACFPTDFVESVEDYLGEMTGREAFPAEMPKRLAGRVDQALASGRAQDVPFDLRGVSPFQRAVLRKTTEIPPGEVRPYGWVAREIGKPKAVRAVGTALARNPVPVLIPCHRVVRSDGTVGQYAYGSERKKAILRSEGVETTV
ncbi:MAG: methylated-DNA--[protein]-cysteine S-methyltransferase [Acidimicrobiia bacterium]